MWLVGYGWNDINYFAPCEYELVSICMAISADCHSYVDAQSTVISGVDILILLGVISPLIRLDFLYIMVSSQASAYYVYAWISMNALVFRPSWWWESDVEYDSVIISHS
jgi:hypothetical protein